MRQSAAAFRKSLILLCGGSCGGCLRRSAVVPVKSLKTRVRRSCGAWLKRAVVGVLLLRSRDSPPPLDGGGLSQASGPVCHEPQRHHLTARITFWADAGLAMKAGVRA